MWGVRFGSGCMAKVPARNARSPFTCGKRAMRTLSSNHTLYHAPGIRGSCGFESWSYPGEFDQPSCALHGLRNSRRVWGVGLEPAAPGKDRPGRQSWCRCRYRVGLVPVTPGKVAWNGIPPPENSGFSGHCAAGKTPLPHPTPHIPPGKSGKKVPFLRRQYFYFQKNMMWGVGWG